MKVKGKMAVKKESEFHIVTCVRSHFVKESQEESEYITQKNQSGLETNKAGIKADRPNGHRPPSLSIHVDNPQECRYR